MDERTVEFRVAPGTYFHHELVEMDGRTYALAEVDTRSALVLLPDYHEFVSVNGHAYRFHVETEYRLNKVLWWGLPLAPVLMLLSYYAGASHLLRF